MLMYYGKFTKVCQQKSKFTWIGKKTMIQKNIISLIDNGNYSLGFINPMGLRCVVASFCFMASSVRAI